MTAKTHILAGGASALLVLFACKQISWMPLSSSQQLLMAPAAAVGALLPDVDLPSSRVGSIIRPLSASINKAVGHRTFCHSFLCAAMVFCGLSVVLRTERWIAIAVLLGMLSHLLLDVLNKTGVALFWPNKKKISIGSIPLNGFREKFLVSVLSFVNVLLLVKCFLA